MRKNLTFLMYSYIFLILISLIASNLIIFSNLKTNNNPSKILGETITRETQISANIGILGRYTLFGYTSPNSKVILEGQGVYEETRSNELGYFEFKRIFLPLSLQSDLCLSSQDNFGRITKPVCFPALEETESNKIGPFILPPTLSTNKSFFFTDEEIIISGQSIPNSKVKLYFFKEASFIDINFPKTAFAQNTRTVETKTDEKGNFTFVLNSSQTQKLNTFAAGNFQNEFSPQSINLKIKIYPFWMIFILGILNLLPIIKNHLLEIILLLELFIVLYLGYKKILAPQTIVKTRAIVKYQPHWLVPI